MQIQKENAAKKTNYSMHFTLERYESSKALYIPCGFSNERF